MEVVRVEPLCKGCLSNTLVLLSATMVDAKEEEEVECNVDQALK